MTYAKHLETKDFYFLCDIHEGDENASTKMYDTSGKLISDNYLAHQYLCEILMGETEEIITFISAELKIAQTEINKN